MNIVQVTFVFFLFYSQILLDKFFQLHVQYCLQNQYFFVVGSHNIFHGVYYNSQQTPVSEDTTALFGPPLETTFGEPKIEGKPFLYLFTTLSLSFLLLYWSCFLVCLYC